MNNRQRIYGVVVGVGVITELLAPFSKKDLVDKLEPDLPEHRYEFRMPVASVAGYTDTTFSQRG